LFSSLALISEASLLLSTSLKAKTEGAAEPPVQQGPARPRQGIRQLLAVVTTAAFGQKRR
ncbi:TPA: hypothetical protein ACQTZE_006309, partial [Pseudomonas aeruginosa]